MRTTRTAPIPTDDLRRARLALLGIALAMAFFASAQGVQAQDIPQNKAGIVVDFGSSSVYTACVDLGADGQATGEELLQGAGFDVLIEYSSQGGAVCKIGAQGCNYPDQPCWCQCMSSPCVYWAYHHLEGAQWLYATEGASSYVVHSGEVDGWAWGAGTVAQGAQPPVRTFEEICAPPTPTPTSTTTWTPIPTATPTTAATIWVPWPTATPTPTAAGVETSTPTWTPNPTATPTPTWTAGPSPTAAPSVEAASTAPSVPTATSALLLSNAGSTPAAIPATATPEAAVIAPSATPPLAEPSEPGREQVVYVPFIQRGEADPAPIVPEPAVAPPAVAITTTQASTLTGIAMLPGPPAAAGLPLARGRALETTSRAGLDRLQNAPFSAEADSLSLTQAAPDPVGVAVLALLLIGVATTLRAIRRWGPRTARLAWRPKAVAGAMAAPRARTRRGVPQPAPATAVRTPMGARSGLLSLSIYGLTAGIGLLALLQPFLTAALGHVAEATATNAPLLVTILMALCFLALLFEVQGQAVSAKMIALLGVLVAINSVLRFVEVSIPGPGGFTPVFFLIVLTGYVFGGRLGFLMGALTMLVSGLITGGVGPWLPGQMFTAGWMGLLAPLARPLGHLVGGRPGSRAEVFILASYAGMCGLFYGLVINLWFWPFMTGPTDQYWQAGVSLAETARRYAVYYVATSLVWDVFAVAGNVLLVGVFGAATLAALRRFQQRFDFEYRPPEPAGAIDLLDRPAGAVTKAGPAMALSEGRGRA